MMDYYTTLLKMGCFTLDEVTALTGNVNTAGSVLRSYKKKGRVLSVRRNLYVAVNPMTDAPVPTPYEVASHLSDDACLSHHSAFEWYGFANQVFSDLYVSSAKKFNTFSFDGRRFRRVESEFPDGVKTVGGVRVTELERTVIDGIRNPAATGGFEELFRCLSVITYADADKLIRCLTLYGNRFLWQKAGFCLSLFPNMKLPSRFFSECKKHIGRSVRYLYAGLKEEGARYAPEWGLYVPVRLPGLGEEGGDPLV